MLTMVAAPYLTDTEIADICAPLKLAGAQVRHLEGLGLLVKRKPNGRPLVARSEFERVLGAARMAIAEQQPGGTGPNVAGLQQWARGRKHGAQAQGR